jgi:hypothetical protein
MKLACAALTVVLSLLPTHASPLPTTLSKRIPVIDFLNDVLVFDSPGFQNPADATQTMASVEAFVFLKQLNLSGFTGVLADGLSSIGIDAGQDINTALDRLKLFAAVGVPKVKATVNGDGCSETPELLSTSVGDLGLTTSYVSFGNCAAGAADGVGEVALTIKGDDFSSARIFPSGPDGFGVISGAFPRLSLKTFFFL